MWKINDDCYYGCHSVYKRNEPFIVTISPEERGEKCITLTVEFVS